MIHYDAPAPAQLVNTAANSAQFELKGGIYSFAAVGTWGGGNVEVQKLGPDGSTFISMSTAVKLLANGVFAPSYFPPGQYKIVITTATAVYTELSRVPIE